MAIPFLNNLDISNNQLLNAKLQITGTAPNAAAGQIYFDSTVGDETAKYYSNVTDTWVSLKEYSFPTGTYVTGAVTGTFPKPIITFDLNAVDGTAAAGERYLTKTNKWAEISTIPGTYNWDLQTDSGTGAKVTVGSGDTVVFTSGNSTLDVTNSGLSTSINLPTTAVTAGSYTYTALTVDAYGRITAASSGTSPVTSITGGTDITITGTAAVPIINQTAITRLDTVSTAAPAAGATFTAIDNVTTSTTGNITALNLKTITLPADTNDNTTYTLPVTNGDNPDIVLTGSDSTTDAINVNGTGTTVKVTGSSTNTLEFDLVDDVTIVNNLTVGGTGNFTGQVTIPILPAASTDAASKDYVDNAVVGGLVYQGGYDAATNTPDLTTSPNSILKGWTYTVTADGTFFSEQLRVGDVLIAEVNDPSALGDWTTVQNNIDLASLTQVGIGNVNIDGAGNKDGLSLGYASGTAIVGLGITSLPSLSVAITAADLLSLEIPLYNGDTSDANEKVEVAELLSAASSQISYATTITDTATVTHGLGTKDVIIQLYDVTTNETVYADVLRVDTAPYNTATITFASTPTNSIRVLVQKIG